MVLYGASGHAKVIIDILEANGETIDFIIDDNHELTDLMGYEVRRNTGKYDEMIISIGSCMMRERVAESIEVRKFLTAVHPSAVISPRAKLGGGTVVMQGAVIQSCTRIGEHCIVNTGASVDHDCVIGDFVHIAPHATVLGGVKVGRGTWIGAGSVVRQNVTIGENCMIGAGAVVIRDVPDGATVVGVPGKEI